MSHLECTICLRKFSPNKRTRTPFVINCGHSFCFFCVKRLNGSCFHCRNEIKSVRKNYQLIESLEHIKREHEKTRAMKKALVQAGLKVEEDSNDSDSDGEPDEDPEGLSAPLAAQIEHRGQQPERPQQPAQPRADVQPERPLQQGQQIPQLEFNNGLYAVMIEIGIKVRPLQNEQLREFMAQNPLPVVPGHPYAVGGGGMAHDPNGAHPHPLQQGELPPDEENQGDGQPRFLPMFYRETLEAVNPEENPPDIQGFRQIAADILHRPGQLMQRPQHPVHLDIRMGNEMAAPPVVDNMHGNPVNGILENNMQHIGHGVALPPEGLPPAGLPPPNQDGNVVDHGFFGNNIQVPVPPARFVLPPLVHRPQPIVPELQHPLIQHQPLQLPDIRFHFAQNAVPMAEHALRIQPEERRAQLIEHVINPHVEEPPVLQLPPEFPLENQVLLEPPVLEAEVQPAIQDINNNLQLFPFREPRPEEVIGNERPHSLPDLGRLKDEMNYLQAHRQFKRNHDAYQARLHAHPQFGVPEIPPFDPHRLPVVYRPLPDLQFLEQNGLLPQQAEMIPHQANPPLAQHNFHEQEAAVPPNEWIFNN